MIGKLWEQDFEEVRLRWKKCFMKEGKIKFGSFGIGNIAENLEFGDSNLSGRNSMSSSMEEFVDGAVQSWIRNGCGMRLADIATQPCMR
jgi:hypothetical protein